MPKYIGAKNNNICVVSNNVFSNDELDIIEVPDELSYEDLILNYKVKNNKLINKSIIKDAKDLKIALVSNYGTKCGIGTYSKFLYKELINFIGDYKIFSEIQNKEDLEFNIPNDKIIPCWKRGESLSELIKQIKLYDPDIILIQHEWGLFPNARYMISMMTSLSSYRIITTMHSIFHHKDKTIVEAALPEIIVHLSGAKNVLKNEKKLSSKVYTIPHGCFPCVDKTKLWNFYKSDHTFLQFGFMFRYKNFENSIKSVSILKEKYDDIFFTGLLSESPFAKLDHEMYYNELKQLINDLDIQENVGLIRGYQSEEVLNSFMRTNIAAVFPYMVDGEHACYGSSGAAPTVMASNIPVITSSAHHFQDLPSIKADSPEEIAKELDKLFSNETLIKLQVEKQNLYLESNSWKNIAEKYVAVFEKRYDE
jgi:glycosyltransferase involved in cell wall biosynthesis